MDANQTVEGRVLLLKVLAHYFYKKIVYHQHQNEQDSLYAKKFRFQPCIAAQNDG